MSPLVSRQPGESWRDCALRYAKRYGLESEVLAIFDAETACGTPEEESCWFSLGEWDLSMGNYTFDKPPLPIVG